MTKIQIDQSGTDETAASIGSLLKPLFMWQGREFYPVRGAEGDDGDDGNSDGEPNADGGNDDGEGSDDTGSDKPVSREDFEKQKRQLQAADKKRTEAERELRKIQDAKKDELTKATERADELEKTVAAKDSELAELRLHNAFLSADVGITWHDPADALALAERRGYLEGVVGEDGKVDAKLLGTKLKEMAKAKPNLVKTAKEDGGSGDSNTQPKQPTGQKVGSKGKDGKGGEPDLSRYQKFITR